MSSTAEKMEYSPVIWGPIIMGGTGLVIWFKIPVTHFLPRWAVEVELTIHYYEAILACLAIVVWHFYHVILDPDVFPFNWACWDGYVSSHWQEEEHPMEVVTAKSQRPPTDGEAAAPEVVSAAQPERTRRPDLHVKTL